MFQGALHDGTKVAIKTLRIFDKPGQDSGGQKILKVSERVIVRQGEPNDVRPEVAYSEKAISLVKVESP